MVLLGDITRIKVDAQIDKKFKESLAFDNELHKRRQLNMKALRFLADYEKKHTDLQGIKDLGVFRLNLLLAKKSTLTSKELDKAFSVVQTNLKDFRALQGDVNPDIQEYHAYLKELQALSKRNSDSIKKTRRSIIYGQDLMPLCQMENGMLLNGSEFRTRVVS